jgi:hypothetical protein
VENLVSNEKNLIGLEIDAGNEVGVQIDTGGYKGNTGGWELRNQNTVRMCFDHAYEVSNGKCN